MVYFSTLCLIASVIFYGVGKRAGARKGEEMGYLDALFLGVTSATGAGLGNVCPIPGRMLMWKVLMGVGCALAFEHVSAVRRVCADFAGESSVDCRVCG